MKSGLIVVVAFLVVTGCLSNRKQNASRNPYDGVDFTVKNLPQTLHRLDSVIVPQVSFQDASIDDVIQWIDDYGRNYEVTHNTKAVRYLACFGDYPVHGPIPGITFTATNISLLEVIKAIARTTGLDYVVYDQDLLEFRDKPGQPTSAGDVLKAAPEK